MSSEQIESVQVILGPATIINHALKRSYRDNLAGAMSGDNHASPVRVVVNVMAPRTRLRLKPSCSKALMNSLVLRFRGVLVIR